MLEEHVHAVDYFRSHANGQCQEMDYTTLEEFKQNTEGGPVTIWIGSSLHACRNFEPNSLDLVFIDALHTYDAVRSDILSWWSRLKMGGIMCFHDYVTFPDVTRAIDETFLKLDGRAHSFVWGTENKEVLKWEPQ
jgi:predicted O-methyltransferase YrrM